MPDIVGSSPSCGDTMTLETCVKFTLPLLSRRAILRNYIHHHFAIFKMSLLPPGAKF
jgi:hypothetical protein